MSVRGAVECRPLQQGDQREGRGGMDRGAMNYAGGSSSMSSPRPSTTDWGPIIVAVILFVVLSPGLLFQLPSRTRVVEFGNMATSAIAILVHAVIFFCLLTIFVVAIGVHVYAA